MREIINSDFDASQHQVAIVDFWADWCMPCKIAMPTFKKLAEEMTQVQFFKANVDENSDLIKTLNISGVPAFIIFKNGSVFKKLTGVQSEANLRAEINKALQ